MRKLFANLSWSGYRIVPSKKNTFRFNLYSWQDRPGSLTPGLLSFGRDLLHDTPQISVFSSPQLCPCGIRYQHV